MAKVIVQHHVADYAAWLTVFKAHGEVRRQHGSRGASVTRSVADPNTLLVVNDFETVEGAQAFAGDQSLRDAMARAGVSGAPQVWITEEADSVPH